jgi:ornithine cyclodeaminase/alanine dehydrogenase-like protein (mu-crystallin family)
MLFIIILCVLFIIYTSTITTHTNLDIQVLEKAKVIVDKIIAEQKKAELFYFEAKNLNQESQTRLTEMSNIINIENDLQTCKAKLKLFTS